MGDELKENLNKGVETHNKCRGQWGFERLVLYILLHPSCRVSKPLGIYAKEL